MLLPKDPVDDRNVIVEIRRDGRRRGGGLFGGDLLRMYARWAERHGLKTEILSQSETDSADSKRVIFQVKGTWRYSQLKFKGRVHGSNVPVTEAQGRIHTSTATVAVLPRPTRSASISALQDVRIDVFRAISPGGQSVNTTDSAIRVTHLPTGLVVSCQDEKSQLQNRIKAMAILHAAVSGGAGAPGQRTGETRRNQVGSGERSEKIRTYNFPQNRVTDHRIGRASHNLVAFLDGEIDEFIDELAAADRGGEA